MRKNIHTVIKCVPVISGVNLHSNTAISADMMWQDRGATQLHCPVKHVSAGTPAIWEVKDSKLGRGGGISQAIITGQTSPAGFQQGCYRTGTNISEEKAFLNLHLN